MAETTDETSKSKKVRPQTELWVLAAVAAAALLCVSALAVALALILGKGSLIQVNPVINGTAPTPAVSAVPDSPKPMANRTWNQEKVPDAFPAAPLSPLGARERQVAVRADNASPPSPPFATPQPKVYVREEAPSFYAGDHALPMPPVRHRVDPPVFSLTPAGASPASASQAPAAMAPPSAAPTPQRTALVRSAPAAPAALPTLVPATLAPAVAKAAPTAPPAAAPPAPVGKGMGTFAGGVGQGALAELRLLDARSTDALAGFSAPKGNLFFVAHVLITNKGGAALSVDSGAFDLRDADGNSYMANPEADASQVPPPVQSGAKSEMTVSFPVPDDVELRSLALVLPSETDLIPLSKK